MQSHLEKNKITWWGTSVSEASEKWSLMEVIERSITGRRLSRSESKVIETILIAMFDHGLCAPSTSACVVSAFGSGRLAQSVASGLLAIGKIHGCFEDTFNFIGKNISKNPEEIIKETPIIPGFGHPLHSSDPRVIEILKSAGEITNKESVQFMERIESELKKLHPDICMNPVGAISAVIRDMGMTYLQAESLIVISRSIGMCGHAIENITNPKLKLLQWQH